ncbi:endonuclease [Psychroserpens sp.]|uniref:endonuclease n=1 Tax=Psychroserpens sp. TaxID=2020870 RepID=UPI0038597F45
MIRFRQSILLIFCLALNISAWSQVGVNTSNPDNSSALDVTSTTKGVLPPRMTSEQRDNIMVTTASAGLIIFNTDSQVLNIFDGTKWHAITTDSSELVCLTATTFNEFLVCLQTNYTPNQTLGYGPARDVLYGNIDVNSSTLELSCIYTDFSVVMDYSTDPDPSSHAFNQGINTEHAYPQSMGAGDEPARSDMFNIFPSRIEVNSSRSNCPYNDIIDIDTESWFYLNQELNSVPSTNMNLYSEKDNDATYASLQASQQCTFEPREDKKGDIARAIFYFHAIYNASNQNTYLSYANDAFFFFMKFTLLQWHTDDPVDQEEIDRNNAIKLQQGNDNPFIIDATLASRVYN